MISNRFTATEWLTGNMHRSYPLDESTAGVCPIPPALLADMFILVNGAEDDDCSFYISEIRTTDTSITVSIAGDVAGVSLGSTPVATFPIEGEIGSAASTSIPLESYVVYVKLVAGDLSVADAMPVHTQLGEESGKIFTGCVRGVTGLGTGSFVVNGTRLPEQVTLTAGQGVELDVHNFEASVSFDVTVAQTGIGTNTEPYNQTVAGTAQWLIDDYDSIFQDWEQYDSSATIKMYNTSIDSDGNLETELEISMPSDNPEDDEPIAVTTTATGVIVDETGEVLAPPPGTTWDPVEGTEVISEISPAPVIAIRSTDFEPPAENMTIIDDASLLAAAIAQYGTPIRSINAVYPDASGNITIVPDGDTVQSEEDDTANFYACIAGINNAAGAIRITLSHAVPCESIDIVDRLMTNIKELNSRASELQALITKLDAANSNLAVKVAEMIQ